MRHLTIVRKKKFIACGMKVYVYLETRIAEDIILDDIPCIKVGFLKNGKSMTFDIPEEAINVFVVYDKFFPSKYNCKFLVPIGTQDLTLYTIPKFDPFNGYPFELKTE